MKKSFADIVRDTDNELRQRLIAKVPQWASAAPDLRLPARLNVEQCSSAAAARYKAALAPQFGRRVADLTGGLGVDAWAFAGTSDAVLYNEMNPALCEAVRYNFGLLGLENVVFRNKEVRPGAVPDILEDFGPDVLFLDPARRSDTGRKVFRLEDCSPDLGALQDELLAACPRLLVKLSPMADITLLRRQLKGVSQVHVVGVDGECKELLLLIGAGADFSLTVTELRNGETHSQCYSEADRRLPCPGLGEGDLHSGKWLFEPGAALMKSECHAAACAREGLRKLAPSTHLYLAGAPVPALVPFGRFRQIVEVLPLDKRTIADAGRRYPRAEVSARNVPMASDELRRRLGVSPGGDCHIYGATAGERRVLVITSSI